MDGETATKGTFNTYLRSVFGIDSRSLALFRIGVAGLVIADLLSRVGDVVAHYTDAGVLPAEAALELYGWPTYRSLHWYGSSSPIAQYMLFAAAGAAAVALLIGYRTRIATCVTWFLLVSLHARNVDVLGGGDALLRAMLFWSMFVNLGTAYSVDAALDPQPRRRSRPVFSMGSAAMLLQLCIVYWFTSLLKLGGDTWSSGRAMHYTLHFDYCAKALGIWLRQFEGILPTLTYAAVWFQSLGPFLVFVPKWTGPVRSIVAVGFMAFHVGTYALVAVGLWAFIGVIAWTLFVPAWFWDKLAAHRTARAGEPLEIRYDGDCAFCLRMVSILRTFLVLPNASIRPAQDDEAMHLLMRRHNSWVVIDGDDAPRFKFAAFIQICRRSPVAWLIAPLLELKPVAALGTWAYERVAAHRDRTGWLVSVLKRRPVPTRMPANVSMICAFMLAYTLVDNTSTLHPRLAGVYAKSGLPTIGLALSMNQRWSLFAPDPRATDYWYVVQGARADGGRVSLVFDDGAPVSWDKPLDIPGAFEGFRWHHYFLNLATPQTPRRTRLRRLAAYLARDWNARHEGDERVVGVSIHVVVEVTHDTHIDAPQRHLLLKYNVPSS